MNFHDFMSGWGWVLFSLISAIFSAAAYLLNQYLKQPGHLLVFWSRVATVLMLAPLMLHITLPEDPYFYMTVAFTAFFGAFSDIRTYNVAARYGGGVVARVQPLVILLSFILWFFFDPGQLQEYMSHPHSATMILLALSGCIYFSSRLGNCTISRTAFVEMLPALLGYTLTTVLNKWAMHQGPLTGAVFGYMYVQSALAVLLTGGYAIWRESRTQTRAFFSPTKNMTLAALALAAGWICSMIFKNYAMAFIPNPSYQAAIGQMTPIFIALFYWRVRHREEADVASGMGVVFCTALLVLVAGG